MPRFFFDIHDGPSCAPDNFGDDFENLIEARDHAQAILADVLGEAMPDGEERTFICEVRDEAQHVVYQGRLSYHGETMAAPSKTE